MRIFSDAHTNKAGRSMENRDCASSTLCLRRVRRHRSSDMQFAVSGGKVSEKSSPEICRDVTRGDVPTH